VSKPVTRHPAVEQDILDIARWIARDSKEAALKFFFAVEETVEGLRLFPGKGSPKQFRGVGQPLPRLRLRPPRDARPLPGMRANCLEHACRDTAK